MEYKKLNTTIKEIAEKCKTLKHISLKPCPPRIESITGVSCYIGSSSMWSNVQQTSSRSKVLTLSIEKSITLLCSKENINLLYIAAEEVTNAIYLLSDNEYFNKVEISKILFLEDEIEQKTNGENVVCHFELRFEINKKVERINENNND